MSNPNDFPHVGEVVIGTCTKISNHGAYFLINGFEHLGKEAGFVHISEISKTWVRQIRKHIQLNQRTVAKVLRVNPARGEVDLSIRRVSESQRRKKLEEFKHEKRAASMITALTKRLEFNEKESDELFRKLYEISPSLYKLLKKVRKEGSEPLNPLDDELAEKIHETVKKELVLPTVELVGIASVSIYEPNGVEILKTAFEFASEKAEPLCEDIEVSVSSSPEYRVIIDASNWKEAETAWSEFQNYIEEKISNYDADYSFKREEE